MKSSKFVVQFLETVSALITAAFGLVAALAWNETIKELINQTISAGDAVGGLAIYAVIVTVIAVVATMFIAWLLAKAKSKVAKEEAAE